MYNFIQKCINGDALALEVDDYIDEWHEGDSDLPLHIYLGMTEKEYKLFVDDEKYLDLIIASKKKGESIENIYKIAIALAARSDNHEKSKQLEKWLNEKDLW